MACVPRMVMEYQDEEFYKNLPRKELQGLCKKHGLPAKKASIFLARSLASFFKKGRVHGPLQEHCSQLPHEEPPNFLKETNKVHEGRLEGFDVDSNGLSSHGKKENYDKCHSQSNKEKDDQHVDTLKKVAVTAPLISSKDHANLETTEGFSNLSNNNKMQPVALPNLQGTISSLKLSCQSRDHQNGHPNSRNLSSHASKCCPQIQCGNKAVSECPAESGLVSSSETSMELRPSSFQFFVRSEEGIKLFVDLNSGPSDWIKVLKDEVCIYQKVHQNKSHVLHEELRGLGESGECMKTSFIGYLETGFRNKEDVRKHDAECIKSSSRSFGRENCNHNPSDEAVANNILRSSAETLNSSQGEESRHGEDGAHVVSSISKLDSGLQNQKSSINVSCVEQIKTEHQHSSDAVNVNGGCASVSVESPQKCTQNRNANLNLDEANGAGSLELRISETASVCQLVSGANDNNSRGSSENVASSLPDTFHHHIQNKIGQESQSIDTMEMQFSGVKDNLNRKDMSTLSRQFVWPLTVDTDVKNVKSEGDRFLIHQLDLEKLDGYDNSAVGDKTFGILGEKGTSATTTVEESSEYSLVDNTASETNKTLHSSELSEEVQKKRKHESAQNLSSDHFTPRKNLRSGAKLANQMSLPRRSKRLVPK